MSLERLVPANILRNYVHTADLPVLDQNLPLLHKHQLQHNPFEDLGWQVEKRHGGDLSDAKRCAVVFSLQVWLEGLFGAGGRGCEVGKRDNHRPVKL